jgi:hypothetical protein
MLFVELDPTAAPLPGAMLVDDAKQDSPLVRRSVRF